MIRLDIVRTVFAKELREMLRDRRSLAVMFGLPLVLYPLLAIGIASLTQTRQQALTEEQAQVAIPNAGAAPELFARLKAEGSGIELRLPPDVEPALSRGDLDAVIDVPERAQARAIMGEPAEITVRLDRSRSISGFVETKVSKVLDDYQRWIIEQRLKRYAAPPAVLEPLKTTTVDVAASDQAFGRILSQMLPLLLMMTGMLGALFPALNATTTERELGTLETLLVTPAGRTELLLAKGALVLISALLTAGLNMLSMSLVLLKSVSMLDVTSNLTISPLALLLTYIAAIPALIFFSAIVLIVGLLARNFREANAYATPTMLLPLVSLAVGIAEPEVSPGLLITPVANTTVIIREVLTGRVSAAAFLLAFASSCLFAGIVLSLAARVFSSEQLVNPAWEPLSLRGFGRRGGTGDRPRRLPPVDAALFLFVTSLLLVFYLQPSPLKWSLLPIVVINQLLLILAPALLFAFLGRWKWRETFKLFPAAPALLFGAALLGIGVGPWVNLLSGFQQTFWPRDPNSPTARLSAELIVNSLIRHPLLTVLLVGTLAGVCEEMLFRGPLQTALVRKLPAGVALSVTAFLFAAAHMDLHGLPVRFGLGLLLGWLVWRGGSIFPAMLAHGLYDATQLAVAAVAVRQVGAEQALKTQAFSVTRADAVMLIVGAALIGGAAVLIRSGLRHSREVQPTGQEPREIPAVEPATPSS